MQGFDPRWRDIPDYIIGITREIWEDRGLATLHQYYAADLPMRFPSGMLRGNKAVIAGTMATLAEFPDRELLGEDVIWSEHPSGYLSSHRLMTMGTHLGHGYFGPPTGKRYEARAIADCAVKDGVIFDEWLVRDSGLIVVQLGLDIATFVRDLIAREGGVDACARPFYPEDDVDGGYHGRGNDVACGTELAGILTAVMGGDVAAVQRHYDRAVRVEHPSGAGGWSWGAAERVWMQLRSALPDAEFTVDHQIGRNDPDQPPRAAVRWALRGRHSGWGMFGPPSGADVYVMGFTHAEWGPYGIKREVTLFDEITIRKQILMHTGAT